MSIETSILREADKGKDKSKLDDILFSLRAARKLQNDRRALGVDRVDLYYHNAEGDWLENWQKEKTSEEE
jgi:hypothetical protein